ncbi:hypothetical protein AAHB53_00485 [Niallia circulans]
MIRLLKWVITILLIYGAYNFYFKDNGHNAEESKPSSSMENRINQDSITSFFQSFTDEFENIKSFLKMQRIYYLTGILKEILKILKKLINQN